jgi:deferrochelatase/peroxidase EfeB
VYVELLPLFICVSVIDVLTQGAPVDLAPLFDDPELGADPTRNNNFTFEHPDATLSTNQTRSALPILVIPDVRTQVEHRCPFSAHIRKTRPRADLGTPEETVHHIMRAGIPYGPEGLQQSLISTWNIYS